MQALLVVDVQNDFLPGGALAVQHGETILPVINALHDHLPRVIATKDWHPPRHGSFASTHKKDVGQLIDLHGVEQILWPDHCIQGDFGAEFPPTLNLTKLEHIVLKGTDSQVDSYSAFFDNNRRRDTGLGAYLKANQIDHLFVVGLATDYCVKATVVDARNLGFKVTLVTDGCRPVNLDPNDETHALAEMQALGTRLVSSRDLL